MTPIDYRNAAWADIQGCLAGLRLAVYEALALHGPCTTRELAARAGLDILTVRPRVTELGQVGWVVLVDADAPTNEGVYRALTADEARHIFERRRASAVGTPVQAELNMRY